MGKRRIIKDMPDLERPSETGFGNVGTCFSDGLSASGIQYEFAWEGFFAVMAFELGLAALAADGKAAFHRFAVAGAVGIGAAEHFGDFVGQGQVAFGHHFEIGDGIDGGFGRKQRQPVGGLIVERHAGNFDDVFAALGFARQVEADGYGTAVMQQFELAQDGQAQPGGDVVDNGAVFDGFNAESFVVHLGFRIEWDEIQAT